MILVSYYYLIPQYIKADLGTRAEKNGLVFNFTYSDKPLYTSATLWDTEVYYTTILLASPGKTVLLSASKFSKILARSF